jgi:hypothetical protein
MPNHLYHDSHPLPELERHPSAGTLATHEGEETDSSRVHLRIVSIRKRLIDPDNVSAKWLIDCCRYAGIIRGDEHDKITLQIEQRKCGKGESEATQIFLTYAKKA